MTTQQSITPGRFAPLAALLAQLHFTHERADYLEDTQWTVYAHPRVSDKAGHFDALIHITPRSSKTSTAQGIRLIVERDNIRWLPAGRTNRRGQVWFPELPFGDFRARLADVVEVQAEEHEQGPRKRAMHGAAAPVQPSTIPWIYYLDDRRVVAILEQGEDGRAKLTIDNEAAELAGAALHYSIGEETGVLTLAVPDSSGFSQQKVPLRQTFEEAQAGVPSFVIASSHSRTEDDLHDLC